MNTIRIELYAPEYKDDFVRLNKEWITTYFRLEESDLHTLNHVEEYILDNGGQVFIALVDNRAVGCCALIAHRETQTFEMAKMAVSPQAQGLGLGRKLGEALISYAKEKGIKQLFLEGNTLLEPSMILYRKLGFKKVPVSNSAYQRCNIMMMLDIE
ncbi:acetyltransferase (GNAT) family protein [Dysgonomonas alginatilytica]|uniref:Acetyltransferase (GNAT) family protein n=1 Tax=Dysgonomonas alginatilytica TaxID=1605892 RepID=A0A2V3Q0Y5_9BACT|nr:GNAT family N-acetyltransferase [Dysgonomonas alginatilytica]PXV68995.1 acetyltransferase (GNAT) family protein [Dysgonomonas alginatilytica]